MSAEYRKTDVLKKIEMTIRSCQCGPDDCLGAGKGEMCIQKMDPNLEGVQEQMMMDMGDELEATKGERSELFEQLRLVRHMLAHAHNRNNELEGEVVEYEKSQKLRWEADRRAIELWQEAHPEYPNADVVWPAHADLVLWLMNNDGKDNPDAEPQNDERPH